MSQMNSSSGGRRVVASVIGGIGGAAYVVINSLQLGVSTSIALGVLAIGALLWILARAWQSRQAPTDARARRFHFGLAYWAIVALEVVLIFGGRAVIAGPLQQPRAVVPWLSLVVGLHFFAFVKIWRKMIYLWLGVLITLSAIVAFGLVGIGGTDAVVALFAGIIPGMVLLAFGIIGVHSSPGPVEPAPARRVSQESVDDTGGHIRQGGHPS